MGTKGNFTIKINNSNNILIVCVVLEKTCRQAVTLITMFYAGKILIIIIGIITILIISLLIGNR